MKLENAEAGLKMWHAYFKWVETKWAKKTPKKTL